MSFPETFTDGVHTRGMVLILENAPDIVNAFIEMTPLCSVKYEVDKLTGYLKVRPQLTSSLTPDLYGFIPQTICGNV